MHVFICILHHLQVYSHTDELPDELVEHSTFIAEVVGSNPRAGGGGIPYETDGDARRLA